MTHMAGNRHRLRDWLAEHAPELTMYDADATYFVWLDCREWGIAELMHWFETSAHTFRPPATHSVPAAPATAAGTSPAHELPARPNSTDTPKHFTAETSAVSSLASTGVRSQEGASSSGVSRYRDDRARIGPAT
jgi:hypothetical protein